MSKLLFPIQSMSSKKTITNCFYLKNYFIFRTGTRVYFQPKPRPPPSGPVLKKSPYLTLSICSKNCHLRPFLLNRHCCHTRWAFIPAAGRGDAPVATRERFLGLSSVRHKITQFLMQKLFLTYCF